MENRQLRVMMVGAHPDDCDFRCGGIALKYAQAGHKVKFLAMVDGSGGHHSMTPEETAARRKKETEKVAALAGIEYTVWDIADCELIADLPTRKRLVREIRQFNPDILFCCRPNDYHTDHRNCSLLVQDASYLLIVPHFCPDVPAMKQVPVIMHFYDNFSNPPFAPDIVIRTDEVVDTKLRMLACHESQVFEWLPYTKGELDKVPADPEARLQWLHEPRLPRDGSLPKDFCMNKNMGSGSGEYREGIQAFRFRDLLIARYGEELGSTTRFAESYAACEYGTPLTEENAKVLFPF